MDSEEIIPDENTESMEITRNQRLFLSFSDFLIIVIILVDLFYLGDLISIAPGDMLMINVVTVSIAFVGYQIKKRLRKINRRKRKMMMDSTSQESQH